MDSTIRKSDHSRRPVPDQHKFAPGRYVIEVEASPDLRGRTEVNVDSLSSGQPAFAVTLE